MEHFPALNADCFDQQIAERLQLQEPPRILILYGSVESVLTVVLPQKKRDAC